MSTFPGPHYPDRAYGGMPFGAAPFVPAQVVAGFFSAVYSWMCAGLALTAVVAWLVAHNDAMLRAVFSTGLIWILILVEVGLVVAISAAVNRIGPSGATALFMLYAAINGVVLAPIVLAYTGASVAATFAATAGMFGAMSLVGMFTRRDLSSLGSVLFMALIGLVIASIVNIFWANSTLYWIVTYAGILIFAGLTAYDTNRLRQMAAASGGDPRMARRLAIVGSLALYLDFINIFLLMLRTLGNRRS